MNVVDSSGWLEYFAGGANADFFAPAIEDTENLIVPVICLYEVFKRIITQYGLAVAEQRAADLFKGNIVDFDSALALSAAKCSVEMKLPMADSMILTTARAYHATLWTQDEHFEGLEGVEFLKKSPEF